MTWFEEFLNETSLRWFDEADRCELEAVQAIARGDAMTAARVQGESTAYRRMARTFRREQVAA